MKTIPSFHTFSPINSLVSRFVSYYYLDIKPENKRTEFTCFPHYNNSISIYSSHIRTPNGEIHFDAKASCYQIFTPVRTETMRVKQVGKIHRVVIVLNPLGVQQFYRDLDFSEPIIGYNFFTEIETRQLFSVTDQAVLTTLLDSFLLKRYKMFPQEIISRSIAFVFSNVADFSVETLANSLSISRRHLNHTFQLHLGLSIKQFHLIVLLRKVIEIKLSASIKANFTALAYDLNFSDQAHLNKVFRKMTRATPREFFKKGVVLGDHDLLWHLHDTD